jgi:hypothetical protein
MSAVTSPTLNSITTGMMKQKEGMVCSVSMIGVTMPDTRSLREHMSPIGMPISAATKAEAPQR